MLNKKQKIRLNLLKMYLTVNIIKNYKLYKIIKNFKKWKMSNTQIVYIQMLPFVNLCNKDFNKTKI